MKILAIMGSPRPTGNTAKLLQTIKNRLPESDEMELITLSDYVIHGCTGCNHCQSDIEHFACVQQDDGNRLLQKIIHADAVLYGTPLYGHNYSGQLKLFLDRHMPLFKFIDGKDKAVDEMEILSVMENKPVGLLVSCQGPVENNTELIQMLFDKFCESSLATCMGKYIFPFCSPNPEESEYSDTVIAQLLHDLQQVSTAVTAQ